MQDQWLLTHILYEQDLGEAERSVSLNIRYELKTGLLTFPTHHVIPDHSPTSVANSLISISEGTENYAQILLRNNPQVVISQ